MKFQAVDGRIVDVATMKGRVVLIDFWATDCAPCVAELPRLQSLDRKLRMAGLSVVGISCDTDLLKLQKFVAAQGLDWPQYFDGKQQDGNRWTQEYGIWAIPHILLIDKNGRLRHDLIRVDAELEDKITRLLKE